MDINQNIVTKHKEPLKSLTLKFLKVVMLLVCLINFIQTDVTVEEVVFIVLSVIFFVLLWSELIHREFVKDKNLYIKIVKNVPIVAAIIVCLFMTPVLIGVFYEDVALLKMIGFLNAESDLNTQGIFVNIFGGLIIVGLFFYLPIVSHILKAIFYKENRENLFNPMALKLIISVCGGILYIILNTLNIMDGITRLVLFFSICIPIISTGFSIFVLAITLFILSIIKTMRIKGENKISK